MMQRAPLEMLGVRQGDEEEDKTIDWLSLFRITSNWHGGQFVPRSLHPPTTPEKQSPQRASSSRQTPLVTARSAARIPSRPRTLVDSSSRFIFTTAGSRDGNEDEEDGCSGVLVFSVENDVTDSREPQRQEALASFRSPSLARRLSLSKKRADGIVVTAIAVDRAAVSGSSVRLVVTYSTGQASLVRFQPQSRISFVEEAFFDVSRIGAGAPDEIVSASFHWPLLVTCTAKFLVRIWSFRSSSHDHVDVSRCEEMTTYSCHWPASFRLEPVATPSDATAKASYRLSIAFSTPVYPIGWSVGFQEVLLRPSSSSSGHYSTSSRSAMAKRPHVVTRIDSPSKVRDPRGSKSLPMPRARRIDSEQLGRPTGLSYEAPFVVVGSSDNGISVFRVVDDDSKLTVEHLTSLQGHTGKVYSVSLNEGRCVTGGSDGSVRVWKLGDEQAALADAAGISIDASWRPGMGSLVTLRSPGLRSLGTTSSSTLASTSLSPRPHHRAKTLADILSEIRSSTHSDSRGPDADKQAIIRWVASAFDRIVSVTSARTLSSSSTSSASCRGESHEADEEQVQVWSFSQ